MENRRSGTDPIYKGDARIEGIPTGSRGSHNRPAPTIRSREQRIPERARPLVHVGARSLLGTMPGTAGHGPRGYHRKSGLRRSSPGRSGTGLPDPDNAGRGRLEDKEIVREVRVFVRLPAVAHLLRELLCLVNGRDRLFPRVIF